MNTKLIMIEGLPGSGKSTAANLIDEILTKNNINAELFLEGNLDHPADYDGVSYFNKSEYESLLSKSGDLKEILLNRVIKKGGDYFLPYRKIMDELESPIADHLLDIFFNNDIYELPLDKNMELITNKWSEFVKQASKDNKTYIFECCFIQNPVTIGMVKYGEGKENVMNYVNKLAKIIESLNPVLIYIDQEDLEYSFKKAINERPKEWSSGFIDYYTNQGYGRMKDYHGVEGTLKVLEARKAIESEIFDMLKIKKEKVNNSEFDTEKYRSLLIEKLRFFEVL